MSEAEIEQIRGVEVVLGCPDIDAALQFFRDRLGFRVDAIFPADEPRVVVISGHGATLRLDRDAAVGPAHLQVRAERGHGSLVAPNGTRIEVVPAVSPVVVPDGEPRLTVSRIGDDATWGRGRAGMQYRDLIPDRAGGRFIASHIRIPEGGMVPDYVHYHRVRFQMIFCHRGWVRVVYEDQGEPFVMQAGDCVLQPPQIRHRVLESSPGLEVVEIGCPALHETLADHELDLPNESVNREREFAGQQFVRHIAAKARWGPWRLPGFEARDLGIGAATRGLASVRVARRCGAGEAEPDVHDGEFLFLFLREGSVRFESDEGVEDLKTGDCLTVPAGLQHRFCDSSPDLELLEVWLPGR